MELANVPDAHETQVVAPVIAYFPTEQDKHTLLPAVAMKVPTMHAAHELKPLPEPYVPAAHEPQTAAPVIAYVPAGHCIHGDDCTNTFQRMLNLSLYTTADNFTYLAMNRVTGHAIDLA